MRNRYSFRCLECGWEDADYHDFIRIGQHGSNPCSLCGGRMVRIASFYFHRPMQEHFNHSLGRPVSGERDYKEGLKRASEAASIRTGLDTNYQPVDMTDTKSLGVTEEGLDATNKRLHDSGEKVSKTRIIT